MNQYFPCANPSKPLVPDMIASGVNVPGTDNGLQAAIPGHSPTRDLPMATSRKKLSHDTVTGCKERAAADLAEAAMMDTMNGRKRLEASAAAWGVRASLLQRLDDNFEKRRAFEAAEWQREDIAEARIAGRSE